MRASTICSLVQSLSKCHRHGTWCFQYMSNYWLDTWGPTKITRLETRMLLRRNNRFEMTVLNRDPIVYWHPALVSESTKLMLNKVQENYEESTPSNLRRTFSWSPWASLVKALKSFSVGKAKITYNDRDLSFRSPVCNGFLQQNGKLNYTRYCSNFERMSNEREKVQLRCGECSPRVGIQTSLWLWYCCMLYMLFSLVCKVSADLSIECQQFL